MRPRRPTSRLCGPLGLLAAALLVLQACGDEAGTPPPVRASTPRKPAAAAPAAAGAEAALAAADIPEKLKTVDWNAKDDLDRDLREARDPFRVYVDDLRPKTETTGPGPEPGCAGPLCEQEAASFGLIAIITGTSVHKAMLVDTRGMGHMVRAGDVVGKAPYRITRITRNEVVMKPLQPPLSGQAPPQEIVKRLVSQEELQELLP